MKKLFHFFHLSDKVVVLHRGMTCKHKNVKGSQHSETSSKTTKSLNKREIFPYFPCHLQITFYHFVYSFISHDDFFFISHYGRIINFMDIDTSQ